MAIKAVNATMCSAFLCDKPAVCKGLCAAHRTAKWRADNPEKVKARERKRYAENSVQMKESSRKWYAENADRAKECMKAWRSEHREECAAKDSQKYKNSTRGARYRLFYNITIEEYERIRDFMRRHPKYQKLLNKDGGYQREAVEHRHRDGLIRGVMAGMLNRAYGLIERLYGDDTAEVLEALAEFHRNPPASQALGQDVYGVLGKAQKKKVMKYGPDGSPTPQLRVAPAAVTFEEIRCGE